MEAELVLHVACDVGTPEGEVAAPGRGGRGGHCRCDSTNTRNGCACLTRVVQHVIPSGGSEARVIPSGGAEARVIPSGASAERPRSRGIAAVPAEGPVIPSVSEGSRSSR